AGPVQSRGPHPRRPLRAVPGIPPRLRAPLRVEPRRRDRGKGSRVPRARRQVPRLRAGSRRARVGEGNGSMIPCSSPLAQYEAQRAEIDAAVARVLAGGRYILGEEVERFEAEFAAYLGTAHAAGVGSGTEALHLTLRAAGIGPGDEVVTVAHTAVATVAAIEM